MTTMLSIENLIKLGFNKNEARVYLSLVKFRKSDARQLIKDTKLHRNIIYDNLEKLINKGFVTYITEGKKRIYMISSPNMLVEQMDEEIKELEEKKKNASELAKEIKRKIRTIPLKQNAYIYIGKRGIIAYHKSIIEKNKNYFIFGAPKESVKIMGELFWENFEIKRIDKKIKVRMIFNQSLKYFSNKLKNRYTEIKYFNKDFEPLTQTDVHEDKIVIIVWNESPIIFIIEDKEVAKSYKKYFETMWNQSKK